MEWLHSNGYIQMGSPAKSTKVIIFVSNVLIWLLGCILIGCGAWFFNYMKSYHGLGGYPNILSIVFVTIGAVFAVMAFLGFYGAFSGQYRKIIFIYGIVLIIIFIAEITLVSMTHHYKRTASKYIYMGLKDTLDNYGNDSALDKAWDQIQSQFECCGIGGLRNEEVVEYTEGYSSWKYAKNWQYKLRKSGESENASVPDSCCKSMQNGCGMYNSTSRSYTKEINKMGCLTKFYKDVGLLTILAAVGTGMLMLQLMSIAISLFL